tara:strand:- start:821 stop:1159 length:339 start_codon:yes stop_codon:yes gene_type:complete
MRKYALVMKIHRFLKRHEIYHDTRIYWNNRCWDYNSDGNYTVLTDIKGSDYFEYANDDTISMSFEGGLYAVMNDAWFSEHDAKLQLEFSDILEKEGYYYELGNAWNLSLYKI